MTGVAKIKSNNHFIFYYLDRVIELHVIINERESILYNVNLSKKIILFQIIYFRIQK